MLKFAQKLLLLFSAITLATTAFLPEIAQAQIRYSPLIIETTAEQGQARGIIEITNGGKEFFRGRIYAEPFSYNQDVLVTAPNSQDLTPFLTFSPREVVIEPGQTRRIRLVSQFLPSTPTGEYRAVMFIEGLEEIQTQGLVTTIKPRFAIQVFVRQGNTSPNLRVNQARFNPQSKEIMLLVSNVGNASALPKIDWSLKEKGNIVATGKSEEYRVIPGGERNVRIILGKDRKVVAGEYELSGDLVWGSEAKPDKLPFKINFTISPEEANTANTTP